MKLLNLASLTTLIVGLVAGALVKMGIEEQTAGGIAQAIMAGVVAAITAYATHAKTLNATPPDKSTSTDIGSTLKMLLVGVLLVGTTLGCAASTPAQRLADAERGITLAANAITAADQAGLIKDRQDRDALYAALEAVRAIANDANAVYVTASTRPSISADDVIRLAVDQINVRLAALNQAAAAAQAGK